MYTWQIQQAYSIINYRYEQLAIMAYGARGAARGGRVRGRSWAGPARPRGMTLAADPESAYEKHSDARQRARGSPLAGLLADRRSSSTPLCRSCIKFSSL
jgi:hypothetical protein